MITVEERFESRNTTEGQNPNVVLRYIIRGTNNDMEAKDALFLVTAASYDGLARQSWTVEPVGNLLWYGAVSYGLSGQSSYNFTTSGGTQKITQSISTVGRYAPVGKTAPDYKGAVGVTKNSVEGVDIVVPVYDFSETHYINDEDMTDAYLLTLRNLTGCVNSGAFRMFAAGEVLFRGAEGEVTGKEQWKVTFHFSSSQNRSNITIGDITGINKGGWDYLWVAYEDAEDLTANSMVKRPKAVYVERVYPQENFAQLNLP